MSFQRSITALACLWMGLVSTTRLNAATLPQPTSATLTYWIDASNLNNDGGLTNPGNGNTITTWRELTTNAPLNIQSTPTWQSTGLTGTPAVRFDGGAAGGDLVFSSNAAIFNISARTIIGVTAMTSDAFILSDLISTSSGVSNIRQTTAETADYFTGNSGDFHFGAGGSFAINGSKTFTIPGGFNAAHVVKSVSPSTVNMNSIRIGDNANNRIWSGDVGEILVYNGVLNGNDTARVNKYLIDKYGINQVVDEALVNTSQIAEDPWGPGRNFHVGVDFNYGAAAAGSLKGINFDNVNLSGGGPPTGPFTLNANTLTAGTTLTLNMPFVDDNNSRGVAATATGTDAASLNALTNQMFYLSNGGNHPSALMTFGNLDPLTDVYVQVIGSHNSWNGDMTVSVNGGPAFSALWTTVTGAANQAAVYGFYGTTDANGDLALNFTVPVGNFAGIGGIILTVVPEPSAGILLLCGTTLVTRSRKRHGR